MVQSAWRCRCQYRVCVDSGICVMSNSVVSGSGWLSVSSSCRVCVCRCMCVLTVGSVWCLTVSVVGAVGCVSVSSSYRLRGCVSVGVGIMCVCVCVDSGYSVLCLRVLAVGAVGCLCYSAVYAIVCVHVSVLKV